MSSKIPTKSEPSGGDGLRQLAAAKDALPRAVYLVATPIGNMNDITLRALDVLRRAGLIACEDTRTTGKLLKYHGLRTPMTPYHEHNAKRMLPKLCRRLESGHAVALVSDAGTPLVSDPGMRLVRMAIDSGYAVVPVPGASATLAALTASGLPTDRFLFLGFLPPRSGARRATLADVCNVRATLVIFESARRLASALGDMAGILGDRQAVIAREITKKFEEVRRGSLAELAAVAAGTSSSLKGEVTIVVGPPLPNKDVEDREIDRCLTEARRVGVSTRDAVNQVAAETGAARRRVYARAHLQDNT